MAGLDAYVPNRMKIMGTFLAFLSLILVPMIRVRACVREGPCMSNYYSLIGLLRDNGFSYLSSLNGIIILLAQILISYIIASVIIDFVHR